jgi:hypothetical protein
LEAHALLSNLDWTEKDTLYGIHIQYGNDPILLFTQAREVKMGTDDDGNVADELTSVDLANIWEDNFMYKKINSDLRIVYVIINK